MTLFQAFATSAAPWQNFYVLVGTAAATLIGLMFVAVAFGAGLVSSAAASTARAFLDPPFTHFVTVLVTACVVVCPTTTGPVAGVVLLAIAALRAVAMVRIYRRMLEAHRAHGDIELSDWLSGVVLPIIAYVMLATTGIGFVRGYAVAFSALAIVAVGVLLLGVFGAWELMMWMALVRTRGNGKDATE